jgi:oligoendopeptidase F
VFDRATAVQVELYREENVALETAAARLGNEYNNLSGSLTVRFRDEERTLVAMARYQEEPDRSVREEAWRLVAARRLVEVERIETLFDQLLEVRQRIARNAGFPDYVGYAFRMRGRFDYTPDDCLRFHDAIEAEVMPVLRRLQADRKARLGVAQLHPWDLAVDPLNRPPLRPYSDPARLETGAQEIFERMDPTLSNGFRTMRDLRLLDLQNRKGKAPGGYQYTLSEGRLPFIFMNAVGLQRDVETILHEAGHAFHALACRENDVPLYREPPIEFCEVASMSMELLGAEHLDVFYPPSDVVRARRVHLEGIIGVFPWIATIDAFQHWLYSHPGHTRDDRKAAWLGLMDRFGGDVDWSGFEDNRAHLWHRQLHLFLNPFYYVEYGIAQLGALQVWANSKADPAKALRDYQSGLSLGGSRPLPELFERAGCRFDFGRDTVRPLVRLVSDELDRLPLG